MDNELQALRTLLSMLADVVHFIMVIILLSKRPATVPVSALHGAPVLGDVGKNLYLVG